MLTNEGPYDDNFHTASTLSSLL